VLATIAIASMVVPGCTAYRPVVVRNDESNTSTAPTPSEEFAEIAAPGPQSDRIEVHAGDVVRIRLISGESVQGEVCRVAASEIVLCRPGNYGLEEKAYHVEEIESLEVRGLTAISAMGFALVGFTAVALGWMFVSLSKSGGLD
jgi:hypothetical protein